MSFRRSKYFRGRRVLGGEWDIRVEQAEFSELAVSANCAGAGDGGGAGVTASIVMAKTGNKMVR